MSETFSVLSFIISDTIRVYTKTFKISIRHADFSNNDTKFYLFLKLVLRVSKCEIYLFRLDRRKKTGSPRFFKLVKLTRRYFGFVFIANTAKIIMSAIKISITQLTPDKLSKSTLELCEALILIRLQFL